jgi:nicotinamide-nucleotide amidase
MFSSEILALARQTIAALNDSGMFIVTAESCTGGLIAGALTSIAGSSDVVYGGYITYANSAKQEMVGVSQEILAEHGAVSEQAARAMAEGALSHSGVDIAIAVTGIAGPGGGTEVKPVGLVYIGCATRKDTYHQKHNFGDIGRDAVREATVAAALTMARDIAIYDQP